MDTIKQLYEDAKRLHDNFQGLSMYGKLIKNFAIYQEANKKVLKYKTQAVILHDRYLHERKGEALKDNIPVVTDKVE